MPWKGLNNIQNRIKLAGQIKLAKFAESDIAPMGLKIIDDRTRSGKFLGGTHADKGYSEKWLPLWFLKNGKISRSGTSGRLQYKIGSKAVPRSAIAWRGKTGGKPTAYLVGGYKKYRSLTGRKTDKVNLDYSGRMLRALDARVYTSGKSYKNSVLFYVRKPQDKIAEYNQAKREFVGFSAPELGRMESKVKEFVNALI